MRQISNTLRVVLLELSWARFNFWSGRWLIALRARVVERRLTQALESHGNVSLQARVQTEGLRRLDHPLRLWRRAPPALEAAYAFDALDHVPLRDLQLLVLNCDVVEHCGQYVVRRSAWRAAGSTLVVALFGMAWALLAALTLLAPAAWPARLAAFTLVTTFFWWLWPGISLYTIDAIAAVRRSGDAVQAVLKARSEAAAEVVSLATHHR